MLNVNAGTYLFLKCDFVTKFAGSDKYIHFVPLCHVEKEKTTIKHMVGQHVGEVGPLPDGLGGAEYSSTYIH